MIYGLLAVLLIAAFLYAVISRPRSKKQLYDRPVARLNQSEIRDRWERIEAASQQGEHGLKNAISDADKLLDQVLKQQGFAGETMALRLKRAESRFSDKESIWRAHKLRNAIAHEVNFDVVMSQGKAALSDFHRGLKDLRAL